MTASLVHITQAGIALFLQLSIQASLMLTVLGFGLAATWQDALHLLQRPKLLLRAVLSMNIMMPIAAAVIGTTFSLPFEVKVALVTLAVSPVPPMIQLKQITAGGHREYVVGLLIAMSVLAIAVVPLTLVILSHVFGGAAAIDPAAVARFMLVTVLAPLLVGLLTRHWFPAAAGASGVIIAVAGILLVVSVALLLYGLWPITRMYLGNGIELICVVLAVIGLAVGHFFGGPLPGDRTALAISTASRHPAVALAIATYGTAGKPMPAFVIILLYVVVATVVSFAYKRWRARAPSREAQIESGGRG
jgi:BASS family bile acid:Na+ symporter